jgi:branched-chain amino acid transport system permease protein
MKKQSFLWTATRNGLLGGAIALYLCLVGMVEVFSTRDLIQGVINLGYFILLLTAAAMGYVAGSQTAKLTREREPLRILLAGLIAGALTGATLTALVLIGSVFDLRKIFITASPALYSLLTLGKGVDYAWIPIPILAITGLVGSGFLLLPRRVARPVGMGLAVTVLVALFSGLIGVIMINQGGPIARLAKFIFGSTGITAQGAVLLFVAVAGFEAFWDARGKNVQARYGKMPKNSRYTLRGILLVLLVVVIASLPKVSGPFVSQVIVLIGLYILMGLGLNITLGFAGLLDLGFVAFFAIGAYTTALLTSYGQYGLQHISFWVALPISILVAMGAGFFLGLPVLGIRGDYLAIATLGFGEIVRLMAGSDFLAPHFGGPQGIIGIQKPCIGILGPFIKVGVPQVCNGIELGGPQKIFFIAVIAAAIVGFVAWRLRSSRLGRAWMAIREDEDVAEALGINLIQTKLMAYMLGAAFAGFGGSIFAVLIGSIFASSMSLIVSINVVALIIVGGMGSIPGVIVGAFALVGLPELLREVSEYRFLFYGAALITMMLARPEGLWPAKSVERELHHEEPELEGELSMMEESNAP